MTRRTGSEEDERKRSCRAHDHNMHLYMQTNALPASLIPLYLIWLFSLSRQPPPLTVFPSYLFMHWPALRLRRFMRYLVY